MIIRNSKAAVTALALWSAVAIGYSAPAIGASEPDVTCMATVCTDPAPQTKTPYLGDESDVQALTITADVTRTATCITPGDYRDFRASLYYDRNAAGTAYKLIGVRVAPIASTGDNNLAMRTQLITDYRTSDPYQWLGQWNFAYVGTVFETTLSGGLWGSGDKRRTAVELSGTSWSCTAIADLR